MMKLKKSILFLCVVIVVGVFGVIIVLRCHALRFKHEYEDLLREEENILEPYAYKVLGDYGKNGYTHLHFYETPKVKGRKIEQVAVDRSGNVFFIYQPGGLIDGEEGMFFSSRNIMPEVEGVDYTHLQGKWYAYTAP